MSTPYYEGPVCYQDGWHYTVDANDQPDRRLHLEDTEGGTKFRYRYATDGDTRSWHDRKHGKFENVELQ